ncbi:MAG: right-handed parallel beta-helix repeat-containing protein [Planctomycetota bacterium]|jgi:parallel beta-helix repeat protein
MIPALLVCATANAEPDIVVVDRDNVTITKSCKVRIDRPWIADADGSGVLRITGSDITVDFDGQLLHGAEQSPPDTFSGTGVWISGRNITLRGARISGFKAGIHAVATSGLLIEDCNVSGNFRQRLRSTPRREDPSDWLRPHANDDNEWLTTYGAGVYLEESSEAKVRRVRAWGTQNGIVLDRVTASEVYDNDCSFGSGWGLAMWRSSGNVISRNAFDFRIRGYSHGKYNRGQDSAGILMFEQCSKNIITHNSATHCGDGLFGFAGAEALGQVNPRENVTWYKNRGCSRNEIGNNDFSYAAAHGLELTFSYNNRIIENRLVGNAICGIWAGYGQGSFIARNTIEDNGDMPYGSERGGINIEHGRVNAIVDNTFRNNACGIFLWWDRDEHIMKLPWSAANPTAVEGNTIRHNRFEGDRIGLQLRQTGRTTFAGNRMTNVGTEIDADAASHTFLEIVGASDMAPSRIKAPKPIGETDPIGARARLRGREYIVMTEWGPYDWRGPLLTAVQTLPDRHTYKLLGPDALVDASLEAAPGVELTRQDDGRLVVATEATGRVLPYALTAVTASGARRVTGALAPVSWDVVVFKSRVNPRASLDEWHRQAEEHGVRCTLPALDLHYGTDGPSGIDLTPAITKAALPADHFGTIATATMTVPAGRWRIRTASDDGIRVWIDDNLVIDDWTWHSLKMHTHELELTESKQITIRVEHFELDGHAALSFDLQPAE